MSEIPGQVLHDNVFCLVFCLSSPELIIDADPGMACRYDGTVRTGAGAVVQFLYGEDGMDGTSIESQFFNNLKLTPAQMSVGHSSQHRASCRAGFKLASGC